jgi:hypothetical protein
MKPTSAAQQVVSETPAAELDLLEEDDEFEEFPQEEWEEGQDALVDEQLWEDNWEDDDADELFLNHLRAEITKNTKGKDLVFYTFFLTVFILHSVCSIKKLLDLLCFFSEIKII